MPVEQALENSLRVGHSVYRRAEGGNRYFLERIAYQVKAKNLLQPEGQKTSLANYIEVVQR